MFGSNSTVYKCDLLSITQNSIVNADETKQTNIMNADTDVVATLMVQPTLTSKYFREIITKKLIPVYRISHCRGMFQPVRGATYHQIPKIPCFIKYSEERFYDEYRGNTLKIATAQEVKEYIEKHMSVDGKCDKFSKELDDVFIKAEECYNDALSKNNVSNATAVKSLIKSIRKK